MKSDIEHARSWLLKAQSNFANARLVLDQGDAYDTACFHAQQAAEKCLKAVLAANGREILRIHDLVALRDEIRKDHPGWALAEPDLETLNRYAVRMRYDLDFWPETTEAAAALELAERVREAVSLILPAEALAEPPAPAPPEAPVEQNGGETEPI